MDYAARQQRVAATLAQKKVDTFLVTHLPNVRYLCGFTGSAGVLLWGRGRRVFYTDGRYTEQAHAEVQGARVVIAKGSAFAAAATALAEDAVVGIEADHMTVASSLALRRLLSKGARVRGLTGVVERARMIKDAGEVSLLRRAVRLGSDLFPPALKVIRPGITESEVAAHLEFEARQRGAEGMSFPTIVAAGARSALPHGVASQQPVPARGFVILDFGVILAGYCSDMTRTVHVGKPSAAARRMYAAVLAAQQAGIEAVRPGVEVGEVDRAARAVLRRERLDRYFTHSTGHGVGLEIHEQPRVAREQTEVLKPGMVITIEPGVYVPGTGGVRIEDMVVVTDGGCEVLTPTRKDLITL